MAVRGRYAPKRAQVPYWLIIATFFGLLVAVVPIVAAVFEQVPSPGKPQTAFATAPSGTYAVFTRNLGDTDAVFVAPVADPSSAMEVARVGHLPGYASNGAVSPEGRRLALVTVDAGSVSRPGASLLLVELETGSVVRLAIDVDPLQTPLWAPDGRSIVVARNRALDGGTATVSFTNVAVDGNSEQPLWAATGVLGAYAVAFDPGGRFVSVVIDGRGSTVFRNGSEVVRLSSQITRDWRLSPDGEQLAFIESDVSAGLQYRARVVGLAGGANSVMAQALGGSEQQLGVAWRPGAVTPTFGGEPSAPSGGVLTQALSSSGFEVPLGYSPDGSALATQHWTGASFSAPGTMEFSVVTDSRQTLLPGFTRFLGWAAR